MHFSEPPGIGKAPGTGIPPIRYQRTLLVYLLLRHQRKKRRIPVLSIIRHFIAGVFEGKLEREPSYAWDILCSLSADLGFATLLPHIEKAFEEGLCDRFFDRLEHIEKRITSGGDPRWKRDCEPIDDVVAMMETWACFNDSSSVSPWPLPSGNSGEKAMNHFPSRTLRAVKVAAVFTYEMCIQRQLAQVRIRRR
jgi:hypothetical protein